jgi:hypothetical protein
MNPEYDFADEPNVTNENQADDQSTGDHEDSDEEGVQPTQRSVLGIKKNIPITVSVLGILSLIPFRY